MKTKMKTEPNLDPRRALALYRAGEPVRVCAVTIRDIGTIQVFGIAETAAKLRAAIKKQRDKSEITNIRTRRVNSVATFSRPIKRDNAARAAIATLDRIGVLDDLNLKPVKRLRA